VELVSQASTWISGVSNRIRL